jgi:serine/threonine-protein kinase
VIAKESTSRTVREYVADLGTVFAVFDRQTQDSGNVSWGVRHDAVRWFVKSAGDPADDRPALPFSRRVALLHNAVRVAESLQHPVCPALYRMVECSDGPLLISEWVDGELLRTPAPGRFRPESPYVRFRTLPAAKIEAALDSLFDLHRCLAEKGWIAGDFYDGCLIYDFESHQLHVIDLDHYFNGACTNEMGRMFGSSRFMAPEEFQAGAVIDERTTVFNLGRAICELHPHASLRVRDVAVKACSAAPVDRYDHVGAFVDAWRSAAAT